MKKQSAMRQEKKFYAVISGSVTDEAMVDGQACIRLTATNWVAAWLQADRILEQLPTIHVVIEERITEDIVIEYPLYSDNA